MHEEKLIIDRKVLRSLTFVSCILIVLGVLIGKPVAKILIEIGAIFGFICWIIVFVDLVRNPIKGKTFWIIGMFPFNLLLILVYLFSRQYFLKSNNPG